MGSVRRLRAYCKVVIAGQDVTAKFDPYLMGVTVIDKEGEIDTAMIDLDDREGRLRLPADNDPVQVYLGWPDEEAGVTFDGYVADVEFMLQKRQDRRLRIEAKGIDLYGKGKAPRMDYWGDGKSQDIPLGKVLEEAGKAAGFKVTVDPEIAKIVSKYWLQNTESFMSFAKRLADANGGALKISGNNAAISKQNEPTNAMGQALPIVRVRNKVNLIACRIRPIVARSAWAKTATSYWDQKSSLYKIAETVVTGGRGGFKPDAVYQGKMPVGSEAQAQAQAGSDSAASLRKSGHGWVVFDGEPKAQAQGRMILEGARQGVDGSYKMTEVEHHYLRGGGFTSRADVEQPGADVGPQSYWDNR